MEELRTILFFEDEKTLAKVKGFPVTAANSSFTVL